MNYRPILFMLVLIYFLCSAAVFESQAASRRELWPKMCASCHDGKTAPDKEALRSKYVTVGDFTAAVLNKGDRCMNILKNDKKIIRKIAGEIGLKEE